MAKIVFFGVPAFGHLNPTLSISRELVNRGHEVYYYNTDQYKDPIEKTHAHFVSYGDRLPSKKTKTIIDFGNYLLEEGFKIMNDSLESLRKNPPDLIIHDSVSIWGKVMAKSLGVPSICSITTIGINSKMALRSPYFLSNLIWGCFRYPLELVGLVKNFFKIRRFSKSSEGLVDLVFVNKQKLNFIYTSPYFQPNIDQFGPIFKFIGPTFCEPKEAIDNKKEKNLIYISLGTLFNKRKDFYLLCLKVFKNSSYKVIMSIGSDIKKEDLGVIPENFEVSSWVNQVEVLKRASCFISHGGMNSITESMYHGTPMLLIPQQNEQKMNAKRVQELGAGIMLKNVSEKNLQESIDKLMTDSSYSENAQLVQKSLHETGGYKEAVQEIEKLIETI